LQIERSELDQILERRIEQSLRAVLAIAFLSVRLSVRHIVSNEWTGWCRLHSWV